MSDLPDLSPHPIRRFLASPVWDGVSGVLAIVGFVLALGGSWELFTGNVRVLLWLQARAYAIPLLIGLLVSIFIYGVFVFFAWRTVPDVGYFNNRQRTRREARYSGRRRVGALGIMFSSLSLALVATVGYDLWLAAADADTVVLVADFQGPGGEDSMRVTRQLVQEIGEALKEHPGIQVRTLGWSVADLRGEGSDEARRIGQLAKADIIIWGDYGFEPDLAVYVHFDLLNMSATPLETEAYQIYGDEQIQEVAAAQSELSVPSTVAFNIALGEHLATLVVFTSGLALSDFGAYAEAASAFDTASQVYGNPLAESIEPYIHFMRANTYFLMGDLQIPLAEYTAALESLDNVLAQTIALTSESILLNRGAARRAHGDLTGAINDFDQAIALDPQLAVAYYSRGVVRRFQGDLTGAISDYDQAIALDPQFAVAYYNRGVLRRAQGDLTGAISDYDQAIALDPQDAVVYNNRGVARRFQGDLTGAISDFDQAIALDRQYAGAYNNRGNARHSQGDLTGAISDYDQAIALDPQYAGAYINRGNARSDQGDLTGAISDYDHAISLDPQDAGAYNKRAIARSDQGDLTGAISDYTRYLELTPTASNRSDVEGWIAELTAQLNGQP